MFDFSDLPLLASRAVSGSLVLALAGTAAGLLAQLLPSRRGLDRARYAFTPAPVRRPAARRTPVCVSAPRCCAGSPAHA